MKDSFYLKHDLHAREDRKFSKLIRDHGYRAYGLAWGVIERLYEEDGKLPDDEEELIYELRIDPSKDSIEVLRAVLSSDLFYRRDGKIGSLSVDRRMSERIEISRKRSESGAKGGKSKANANLLPSQEGRKEGRIGEKGEGETPGSIPIEQSNGDIDTPRNRAERGDPALPPDEHPDFRGLAFGLQEDLEVLWKANCAKRAAPKKLKRACLMCVAEEAEIGSEICIECKIKETKR